MRGAPESMGPRKCARDRAEPVAKYFDYYLGTGRTSPRPAGSLAEALALGGEQPLSADINVTALYQAFPQDRVRGCAWSIPLERRLELLAQPVGQSRRCHARNHEADARVMQGDASAVPSSDDHDEMEQVNRLLRMLGLARYSGAFEAAGYDDADFLMHLDTNEARRVGRTVGMQLSEAMRFVGTAAPTTAAPTTAAPTNAPPPPPPRSEDMERVRDLLRTLKLAHYAGAFEAAGYDDAHFLLQLSADEVQRVAKTVGMKPGHAHKFVHSVNSPQPSHGTRVTAK
jgi:hypothetical protein